MISNGMTDDSMRRLPKYQKMENDRRRDFLALKQATARAATINARAAKVVTGSTSDVERG